MPHLCAACGECKGKKQFTKTELRKGGGSATAATCRACSSSPPAHCEATAAGSGRQTVNSCDNCGGAQAKYACVGCHASSNCSKECQRADWKKGGHAHQCDGKHEQAKHTHDSKEAPPAVAIAQGHAYACARAPAPATAATGASVDGSCWICLCPGPDDSGAPLLLPGCGCRGSAGTAHLACVTAYANGKMAEMVMARAGEGRPHDSDWHACLTCGQAYTGPLALGLAKAWVIAVADRPSWDAGRLDAELRLGWVLLEHGRPADAERIFRVAISVMQRHPVTQLAHPRTLELRASSGLGWALHQLGRGAEAEKLLRKTLKTSKRVLGPEHACAQICTGNLGGVLIKLGRCYAAEPLIRELLDTRRRVLGPEHSETLTTAGNLGGVLLRISFARCVELAPPKLLQEKKVAFDSDSDSDSDDIECLVGHVLYTEDFLRKTRASMERVLGPRHPTTKATINNHHNAGVLKDTLVPILLSCLNRATKQEDETWVTTDEESDVEDECIDAGLD